MTTGKRTKILITGGFGMLGKTLASEFNDDFDVIATGKPEGDITNADGFNTLVRIHNPHTVIHCAAMTAVDKCETETELAYKINTCGSANVASACRQNGVRLIAISTDYVFDGKSEHPYSESDKANGGATIYGKSKFVGEELIREICPDHIIARVSWLYGKSGPSFVHTMLKLADGTRPELKVVNDQIGNPTSTNAVSVALREIIKRSELCGTFHLTCEGEASWYEFALEIFRLAGVSQKVIPCTTAEFPRPAPRPANSRLDKMMLRLHGLPPMPNWKDALEEFFSDKKI